MHGHQLHSRDAQRGDVLDRGRMHQSGVGPAEFFGNAGVLHREALTCGFVDDRLVPRRGRWSVVGPVERVTGHDSLGNGEGTVACVDGLRVAEDVAEHLLPPPHLALDSFGVRIDQQLRRIAPHAVRRVPRAVHAIAVTLAGPDVGHVAVPAEGIDLAKKDPCLHPVVVEETQLDGLSDLGEEGEVGARSVVGGAERRRLTGPRRRQRPATMDRCPMARGHTRRARRSQTLSGGGGEVGAAPQCVAAVDGEALARDPAGVVAGQIANR